MHDGFIGAAVKVSPERANCRGDSRVEVSVCTGRDTGCKSRGIELVFRVKDQGDVESSYLYWVYLRFRLLSEELHKVEGYAIFGSSVPVNPNSRLVVVVPVEETGTEKSN